MHKPSIRLVPLAVGLGVVCWVVFYYAWPPAPLHLRAPMPFWAHGPTTWPERAEAVKDAFLHAYHGYQQYAAASDELLPLTDESVNNFNGWGLTLVEGLDTMWIMDLRHEFYETMPVFANMTFQLKEDAYAPFFETVIRYLGGLLSAYALSGEPILLERADDLGRMLLPAFGTPSGLPTYAVNTVTGNTRPGWVFGAVLWSEALSCQLEYKYLAHLTKNRSYFDHVERVMDIMADAIVVEGMFPLKWTVNEGYPVSKHAQFSVGAYADSAHEYLLKQWLMTSRTETKALKLYKRAAASILKHLLYVTPNRGLLYVTDIDIASDAPSHTFEHLSCFLPALLALGAHTLPLSAHDKELHTWAARGLAHTCWTTYADQPTGLGADEMVMRAATTPEAPLAGRWHELVRAWEAAGRPGGVPPGLGEAKPVRKGDRDYVARKPGYHLRPETVESFYIMWRTTGDERWRERGWAVFEAIERETKTHSGYASLESVEKSQGKKKNEMPSFFMAETLKYLYLLFTDAELIPLDRWVFNTEAHPLPIFEWTDAEKLQYKIS